MERKVIFLINKEYRGKESSASDGERGGRLHEHRRSEQATQYVVSKTATGTNSTLLIKSIPGLADIKLSPTAKVKVSSIFVHEFQLINETSADLFAIQQVFI
jgi:hypothetical protein